MFRNSIFKNPIGWAYMVAGNRKRYFMVSLIVGIAGGFIVLQQIVISQTLRNRSLGLVIAVVCAIEMPLYTLRALRSLLIERETELCSQSSSQGG